MDPIPLDPLRAAKMSTAAPEDSHFSSPPRIRAPSPFSAADYSSSADRDEDDCRCRTPTSSEHRIPAELACPPAPRKPRRTATGKRLQPSEAEELLRKVSREEIEAFFRSCELKSTGAGGLCVVAKRTCSCN